MAKRRLNKNLVAFLTATGVVLAVIVVAIAALNAAHKNPELVAAKAEACEKSGDLERAITLYRSAYNTGQNPKYLIEAARCAHELGELNQMFSLLNGAHAQAPSDPQVLDALLERYWEIRSLRLGQWKDVLERSESLLGLEPKNLVALVSKSEALEQLKRQDVSYAAEAEATLRRAIDVDPTDSHVAIVWAERNQAQAEQRAGEVFQTDGRSAAETVLTEACAERINFLRPAIAAHPENVRLRNVLALALSASEDWDACRELMKAGIAQQPDEPELHFHLGNILRQEILGKGEDADEDEIRALVNEGLEHANKAIELEPALYTAYMLRVDLQQLGWVKDGNWESDSRGCQKIILESFAAALRDTVGLQSIRAKLGKRGRLQLIATAFGRAFDFYREGTDEAVKSQALVYLKRFLQEAQTQYPEFAVVSLMAGHKASIDGDDRLAVKEFSRTVKLADTPGGSLEFARSAKEELVKLYRKLGTFGLSLRYTVEVIESYKRQLRVPPGALYVNQIEVLDLLGRSQEALDLLESIAPLYPDNAVLNTVRARLLTSLGRGNEAAQWLRGTESDSLPLLVEKARIAALDRNYDMAEGLLRKALESQSDHLPAIRMLMRLLLVTERADEARQLIQERVESTSDERLRRILQSYVVMLSTDDPEQRKQQLLELIAEVPDEFERAAEYYNFWLKYEEYDRAQTHLDKMERLQRDREDTVRVLQLQLNMALRLEDCERAGKYVTALADENADQVGGALFRGRYEIHCGDPETALSEFRAAEREFPSDAELKIYIAQALSLLQPPRYKEAAQMLEQAVEFDPRSFAARKLLYFCYEQTGRHQDAIRSLEAAARLDPDDDFIKGHAQLLEEERDPRRGIEHREKLREEKPDDVANLLRLAELYERPEVADFALAEQRLLAAIEADPANEGVVRFGAGFFARRGDQQAGEQFLQRHLAVCEGLAEIRGRLLRAGFYSMLDDQQAALSAYQQTQQRVGELFSSGAEEDRRRATILTMAELGGFYRKAQRHQEMIDAYRVVLANLEPGEVASIQTARRDIIRGLLSLRKYGDAEREIASYREEYPKDPQGMMAETDLLILRHKPEEARELLSRILEADPDHAWSRYTRGRINIQLGRYTDAHDDLLRAKTVAPGAFNLRHRLALVQLYELMKKPELAEAELRELLPLARGADREVELRLISVLRKSGQFEKAQEFVNELRARDPDQPLWPYYLGKLLTAREEFGAAAGHLREAVELTQSKNADILAEWLLALIRADRTREATQAYDDLDPQVITPRIQAYAARAYLAQNERDVAVALLEQGIHAGSLRGVGAVRSVVVHAVELLGREEGLGALRRILEHATSQNADLALRSTLAGYLASDDDPARRTEGLELIKEVIAAAPPSDPLHQEALLLQALAMDRMNQPERAVETYEELLRLVPDHAGALNNLAYLLADKLDRAAEALPYAERLQNTGSVENRPVYLDTAGWIYFKNGKSEQAEAILLEALRIAPDYLAARHHLGQIYVSSGNRGAAEREFRRLLEMAREQEDEEYVRKSEEALGQLH